MVVFHHLIDLPAKADQRLRLQGFVDFVEDLSQTAVDCRLVLANYRTKDLLFRPVVVVNVAERRPCPGGDIAHRGSVKALLDKEFFGRFLDPAFVLFDCARAEFGHSYKNERPYFIYK